MNPKVSIIMPCFNGAAHLAKSVGSVLAQTMPDWELILIDDGSTDESLKVIDRFAHQDTRIKALHQSNAGLVATRNRGIAVARGEYITFLDADDTWHPEFLTEMVGALDSRTDAGIAYCGWQNVGLGSQRDRPYLPPDYEAGNKVEWLLKACPWPVHSALVRSILFDKAGNFDSSMSACEDYDLWLRMALDARLVRVPRVLAFYHHHGAEQMTRNRARIALNNLRAQEKFLMARPTVASQLGRRRVRELTLGALLRRGYVAYWQRDLPAARAIFRHVMKCRYGHPKDWFYMLPALLPERWHQRLLSMRDHGRSRPAVAILEDHEESMHAGLSAHQFGGLTRPMTPAVSVVMPCYNNAACLPRSVGSLQAQTMDDWELIVVNDGSTDDTARVLAGLASSDPRIRVLSQTNAGAAAARNRGLSASKGQFTAFLDADDTWEPTFLETMTGALMVDPDAGIAYCGWQNVGLGAGRDDPYVPPDYEAGDKMAEFLRCCPWPIHAALVRAELVRDAGGFDLALSSCMDFDLWLRVGTANRLVLVPQVLAYYHHDSQMQITSDKAKVGLNHLRVQMKFLAARPDLVVVLGQAKTRHLTYGELLHRGYEAYWHRDLHAARLLFREVMAHGYGSLQDWKYMLPALLPEPLHRRLLARRDGKGGHARSSR